MTSCTGDEPHKVATYTEQHNHKIKADIHASSEIGTHGVSVLRGQRLFIPRDHSDQFCSKKLQTS
jgi:hypothetical protein